MSKLFKYILILLNIIHISVKSKTIHYTIAPTIQPEDYHGGQYTTKTYELQVPGSDPIKIIEADEPLWKQKTIFEPEIRNRSARSRLNSAQRKFKFADKFHDLFTTQRIKTTLNEPMRDKSSDETKTNDKSELTNLNKFLNEYTKRFVTKNRPHKLTDDDPVFMEKVDLIEHPAENTKSYDTVEEKYVKRPSTYDNRQGWVSLEAVPWSTSKVSKWESNIKHHTRWPQDSQVSASNYYEDKMDFPARPMKPQYNDVIDKYFNTNKQDWATDVPTKPSWDRNKNYGSLTSSASWAYDFDRPMTIPSNNKYNHNDKDCDRIHGSDIITDGKPGNFPIAPLSFTPYNDAYHRPASSDAVYSNIPPYRDELRPSTSSAQRPATYPESGNGQWVLLSTTKGYQYPKSRQRSLEINPSVLASRKSIHLTVLPALNGSDVNMTTSHGGLIQVDSNSESVDDARKSYIRKMKFGTTTRRPITRKRIKRPQTATTVTNGPDTTAVLAAVGAGMVPATMAMVVPMVLGRKRRHIASDRYYRVDNDRFMVEKLDLSVTQLPDYRQRELTTYNSSS